MDTWTAVQVCQWLARISIDKEGVMATVQQQQITGRILHYMTLKDLEKVFGQILVFGELKAIEIERDEMLKLPLDSPAAQSLSATQACSVQPAPIASSRSDFIPPTPDWRTKENTTGNPNATPAAIQVLGIFDQSTNGEQYRHQATVCVPLPKEENMIKPVHRLICLDLSKKTNLLTFGTEIMKFACACLNDRRNGNIHFGIGQVNGCSGSRGCIVGTALMSGKRTVDYEQYIDKMINNCFPFDQRWTVRSCIKQAKFIEVIGKGETPHYVVECDIVPSALICGNEAFYFKVPVSNTKVDGKVKLGKARLYRFVQEKPVPVNEEDLQEFIFAKEELFQHRKDQEGIQECQPFRSDLRDKLVHLLCQGKQKFTGDTYPILVINKPAEHMDRPYLKDSLSFLSNIPWKVVFDFDSEATICDFLREEKAHVAKVVSSTNAFHERSPENLQDPEKLHKFQESLVNSTQQPWIFSNGFKPLYQESMNPYLWKQRQREGFKDAVRVFGNAIPAGRALVVFCLLSKEWNVMLEAAEEFFSTFPKQWMCMVEEDHIADLWKEKLIERNCADNTTAEQQMVVGMPWEQIQTVISELQGPRKTGQCQLPSSHGTPCILKDNIKNDLIDLEILASNECENAVELLKCTESMSNFEQEVQASFYKGKEAEWWNFWFENQVCRRHLHKRLKRQVENALCGKGEDGGRHVGRVVLYHQPGAGGTTVAKHVMWELRGKYRCVTVKSVADTTEVCGQIMTLRSYDDHEHPKPVVLFLDNQDEEKTNLLWAHLEENAKRITRDATDPASETTKIICVLLLCIRRSTLPKHESNGCLLLKHELHEAEQRWFQEKGGELDRNISSKKQLNPKLMLSFNIMKQNFDPNFIQLTVSSLVKDITDENERKLLKYIAFLNAYDLSFRGIPTAAFDDLMYDWSFQKGKRGKVLEFGLQHIGCQAFHRRWENKLSEAFLVIMNEIKTPALGMIHSLRITSPMLSEKTLSCLQETNANELISDVARQLLSDRLVIKGDTGMAKKELFKIISDVLKNRRRDVETGKPETEFAPVIEAIRAQETLEKATDVLEAGYALTSNPFVAQQLARLYMKDENWQAAHRYADLAISHRPENSYLWDTYGRVYEKQLAVTYSNLKAERKTLTRETAQKLIRLAMQGIQIFRKVQTTSEKDTAIASNDAGYFGEIDIAVLLLDCISFLPELRNRDVLHLFLVEAQYVPHNMEFLKDYEGENQLEQLKHLQHDVKMALKRLEDERLQLREEVVDEYRRNHQRRSNMKLVRLKTDLAAYFGEQAYNIPEGIPEEAKCTFRRRRILFLGGNSLRSIFDMVWVESGEEKLRELRHLTLANIHSGNGHAEDYETLLCASFASLMVKEDSDIDEFMRYPYIVECSRRLYELRGTQNSKSLEPYLFYTMLNWPMGDKEREHTVSSAELAEVLKQWKEAYYQKYPRQKEEGKPYRKKDTTMFFLGNEKELRSICTYVQLRRMTDLIGDAFWKDEYVVRTLKRFEGILCDDGCEVQLRLDTNERTQTPITIATSMPIIRRTWWNRPVFFAIGFSFIGPKAFDINLENPTRESQSQVWCSKKPDSSLPKPVHNDQRENLRAIKRKLQTIEKDLSEIERIEFDGRYRQFTKRERSKVRCKDDLLKRYQELTKQKESLSDW